MMDRTRILQPLSDDLKSDMIKSNVKTIQEFHRQLFSKETMIDFDDMLSSLNISVEEYILAIRSTIKRPQIF